MTDQTMPADKVEKIAAAMRAAMRRDDPYYSDGAFLEDMSRYIRDLEDLLPDPPRPTLADMTPEERAECKWMQADVKDYEITAGIIAKINPTDAHLIASDGETWFLELDTVTPRPDLPRMEWPRDTGIPGVAVGVPVTDPDVIQRISDEAPPGTIVVEANLSATVRNERYWHSAEEAHLTLAEALFYAPHEWDAIAPITVVRWGE